MSNFGDEVVFTRVMQNSVVPDDEEDADFIRALAESAAMPVVPEDAELLEAMAASAAFVQPVASPPASPAYDPSASFVSFDPADDYSFDLGDDDYDLGDDDYPEPEAEEEVVPTVPSVLGVRKRVELEGCGICMGECEAYLKCPLGCALCQECSENFLKVELEKPAIAFYEGLQCALCPAKIQFETLPREVGVKVMRCLGQALAPQKKDSNVDRAVNALVLRCPNLECNKFVDPNPDGCNHFHCTHCEAAFCGICFVVGCTRYHSKTRDIYDREARMKGQAALIRKQFCAVFMTIPVLQRGTVFASVAPQIPKNLAGSYKRMITSLSKR